MLPDLTAQERTSERTGERLTKPGSPFIFAPTEARTGNFWDAPANLIMKAMTRRQFLRHTTFAAGAAALAFPFVGRVLGANDRINVACIGVGGKGDSDSTDAGTCGGNVVALCDVDKNTLEKKGRQYPQARQFQDYRKMLDVMGKEIDAVTVSTPDHHHGSAAIRAMTLGKHCFCQKPLTQTVHEARIMRKLATEKKLATQMGNQGSADPNLRRAIEVVQAGVIGKPLELHVWTNRPIWPQGLDRPTGEDPVPAHLDWDLWLGPAAVRPFKNGVYHTFNWRGWFDFGTGALGDMACHTVNMPFRALKLGYPNVVECEMASRMYPETFPKTSRIRFEFPEREGLPPLKFWWYDGNPGNPLAPLRPPADLTKELLQTMGTLPHSGTLIVGEKGKLIVRDSAGSGFMLAMKDQDIYVPGEKHEASLAVPESIPRSPGHMQEWFRMMKHGTPAFSNFEIAAYLTEIILLGCVALRVGEGYRMEWDGPNTKSPNLPQAASFLKRENRKGWEI